LARDKTTASREHHSATRQWVVENFAPFFQLFLADFLLGTHTHIFEAANYIGGQRTLFVNIFQWQAGCCFAVSGV